MACEQFEPHILDYLENQLPPGERARVAVHLADCAECRAFARQLQELDARLTRALRVPALSPSFNASLRERIQTTPVLAQAEIARRKRQLQAEYEAGLARITLFPRLPQKYFELLGIAAMLALTGWVAWLVITQSPIATALMGLTDTAQRLLFLFLVGALPPVFGLLLVFPRRSRNLWTLLQPAGGSISPALFR